MVDLVLSTTNSPKTIIFSWHCFVSFELVALQGTFGFLEKESLCIPEALLVMTLKMRLGSEQLTNFFLLVCFYSLPRVCLAVSRYILSLDPQRDPLGLLLAIDHFALSTNEEAHAAWLVEFVESEKVRLREWSIRLISCSCID